VRPTALAGAAFQVGGSSLTSLLNAGAGAQCTHAREGSASHRHGWRFWPSAAG